MLIGRMCGNIEEGEFLLCLAVPGKVVKVDGDRAEVDIGGVRREASLVLVADQSVGVGDYVLIHTGYAIAKIDEKEAEAILEAWSQVPSAGSDA